MSSSVKESSVTVGTEGRLEDTQLGRGSQALISTEKGCPKHDGWKARSEFYANKNTKDGLDCYCKECRIRITTDWKRDHPGLNYHTQEQDTKAKARHRAKHRDRHYARYQLQKARDRGLALDHCSWPGCTETENIEGHHPDYSKPYEIMSLCRLHHKAVDLLGDKLGFGLRIIDISGYLKPSKRGRPRKAAPQRVEVAI